MAVDRKFLAFRTTRPVDFGPYRDLWCFVMNPMKEDWTRDDLDTRAAETVHAYLVSDWQQGPPTHRDGPPVRLASVLAVWDPLDLTDVRRLAAVSRFSRGGQSHQAHDLELVKQWGKLKEAHLSLLSHPRQLDDPLPTWVACFGAPKLLENAPVFPTAFDFLYDDARFLRPSGPLALVPYSELLYVGPIALFVVPILLEALAAVDVLARVPQGAAS